MAESCRNMERVIRILHNTVHKARCIVTENCSSVLYTLNEQLLWYAMPLAVSHLDTFKLPTSPPSYQHCR
jgi:hypothetical protein